MHSETNPDTRMSLIVRLTDRQNDDAWTEFVQIYQPVVHRFILRFGVQYADAAEITQEVLTKVARSIESWDPDHEKSTFRGWIYRLTRNQTIDFLRRRKPEITVSQIDSGMVQVATESEGVDDFRVEFEKQLFHWAAEKIRGTFKANNWQAFWRSTVEGRPVSEVAEELGIDRGTVYVARSRIMARLSAVIQERLNEINSPDSKE